MVENPKLDRDNGFGRYNSARFGRDEMFGMDDGFGGSSSDYLQTLLSSSGPSGPDDDFKFLCDAKAKNVSLLYLYIVC